MVAAVNPMLGHRNTSFIIIKAFTNMLCDAHRSEVDDCSVCSKYVLNTSSIQARCGESGHAFIVSAYNNRDIFINCAK